MRVRLTQAFVDKPKKAAGGAERTLYWDEAMSGFGLMVTKSGSQSFVFQYRANGRSRRLTLDGAFLRHEAANGKPRSGAPPNANARPSKLGDARREAQAAQGALARGRDPLEELRQARTAVRNTLKAVAEDYLAREGKALRSLHQREWLFRRFIIPRLGTRPIADIKRSEIVRLLDRIEDENGATTSHHTLVAIRRLFNWHAARDDDFRSPIVPGMGRISIADRARDRVLNDDELRAVWSAAERVGPPYGTMLRFILLTATRLNEAARSRRSEIAASGEWTIPAARYKTKADHVIPLSASARNLIAELPVIGREGWLFTTGNGPIAGFAFWKQKIDKAVLAELRQFDSEANPLPRWTTHDLRRTARSLMSRAGVNEDHAERALGHVIGGVRGTYDRHAFLEEKRQAFEMLAAQVNRILQPQKNVVSFKAMA